MEIFIGATQSNIGFFTIRALLQQINYAPVTDQDRIAMDLINPFAGFRCDLTEISLTDKISQEDQLRFFLNERIERRLRHLAINICERYPIKLVQIFNHNDIDDGSRVFLRSLSQLATFPVILTNAQSEPSVVETNDHEKDALNFIGQNNKDLFICGTKNICKIYLRAGDFWSIDRLMNKIDHRNGDIEIVKLNALSNAMKGATFAAEFLYRRWRSMGSPMESTSANYGLAMLYLRHHPSYARDMEIAIDLLNESYQQLNTLPDSEEVLFRRIFNRNGYALVLFRIGRLSEAIEFLEHGIQQLHSIAGQKSCMHKSVLIYNLAQCYTSQNRVDEAVSQLKDLLIIDPYYPEYHLEIARLYIQQEQYCDATREIERSIQLDDAITESYGLLGFCLLQQRKYDEAIVAYRKALWLAPDDLELVYDYGYCLNECQRYCEVVNLTSPFISDRTSDKSWADVVLLYIEALSYSHDIEVAYTELKKIAGIHGNNNSFQENLKIFEDELAKQII